MAISQEQAVIGTKVVWVSLDGTKREPGFVSAIGPDSDLGLQTGELQITFDDGEIGSTFIGNSASRMFAR